MDSDYSLPGWREIWRLFCCPGTARPADHSAGGTRARRPAAAARGRPGAGPRTLPTPARSYCSLTDGGRPSSTSIYHSTRHEASVHDGDNLYFLFEKYNVNSIDYNIFFC